MANTVDWAYLNAGFGSPRVTPVAGATPSYTNRSPTPSIFAGGMSTPTEDMAKMGANASAGGGVNGLTVADMKNNMASAAANARLNHDARGANDIENKMNKLNDMQSQQLRAIQNQTEGNKKNVLQQLYSQYRAENSGVGGGDGSSNGSWISGDLPRAKQELASAQVNHLLADRDLAGKQAEFGVLSDRYNTLIDQNRRLKAEMNQLHDAHNMPIPTPQSVEIPLLKNTVTEAKQKLATAMNSKGNAERALDVAEHVVNNMQAASTNGAEVKQASDAAVSTVKNALARQNAP